MEKDREKDRETRKDGACGTVAQEKQITKRHVLKRSRNLQKKKSLNCAYENICFLEKECFPTTNRRVW